MTALPEEKWTAERYLVFERESDVRHEFLNGDVFALAGTSEKHNLIVASTMGNLYAQLQKDRCKIYPSDMRVKVSRTGLYTYPDIVVVCGKPKVEDDQRDTLLNPTLIIEVLSPSTESYDRGKKFQHYRTLDSLQDYVLIAQDSVRIECYSPQADGHWVLTDISKPDAELELPSIGCKLVASSVYEQVTFEEE